MGKQITVKNLSGGYNELLFQDVSFTLGENDHVGVVGNNGTGKTTLLRCIEGSLDPQSGEISSQKGNRLMLVQQTLPRELEPKSLYDAIVDAIEPEQRDYLAWRADVVLDRFGAPEELRTRPLVELSGGWQRLAQFARAWVADPQILLIDEPTNHLDLEKLLTLERWMREELSSTPLLVVSHDRRFLDACTNRTLFLRPTQSKIYDYPFSRARTLLEADDYAVAQKQQRDIAELRRLRKSAHTLRQIGVDNYSAAALRKSNQIARRADSLQDSIPTSYVEPIRTITLPSNSTRANHVLQIRNLSITQPNGKLLFRVGQLDVAPNDRFVILGRNGSGKTCFIQRLLSSFESLDRAGSVGVQIGPSIVLGYIDQNMSQLPKEKLLRDFVAGHSAIDCERATALLISAGFPLPKHSHVIGSLSPGEQARLELLSLRLSRPNFYLMDEPTNYLDVDGQEQLEREIIRNCASGVVVSHDRAFIESVGTRFLVIESQSLLEVETPEPFYRSLLDDKPLEALTSRAKIL